MTIYVPSLKEIAALFSGSSETDLRANADLVVTADLNFRGALVYHGSSQAAASGASVYLNWNQEEYDTDVIHDTSTNNERLTVPAGVSKIKIKGQMALVDADVAKLTFLLADVIKNDPPEAFNGGATFSWSDAGSVRNDTQFYINLSTAVLDVTPGDFFRFKISPITSDASAIDVIDGWFAMEIIE